MKTIGVLILNDGKVLLVRHSREATHETGTYGLPAGRVEEDERLEEAAVRECQEETGLKVSLGDLVKIPQVYKAVIHGGDATLTVFLAKRFEGELKNSLETFPEWVDIDSIDNYTLLPNVKEIILTGQALDKKN